MPNIITIEKILSSTDDGIVTSYLSNRVLNAFESLSLTGGRLSIIERSHANGDAGLVSFHDIKHEDDVANGGLETKVQRSSQLASYLDYSCG